METVIRNIGDLNAQDVSVLERVLGRRLRASQRLVIQIVNVTIPNEHGSAPATALPDWCRVYEGLTDPQIDDLDGAIVRSASSRETA